MKTTIEKAIIESLAYLFQGYIENGGTPLFDIDEITEKYGQDSIEIGRVLVNNGWVKNQRFTGTGFAASISTAGILKINPEYFGDMKEKIISTIGTLGVGEWYSIMEILEFDPKDFQIAFDLAKLLERTDYTECQYRHNDIHIKLTLKGRNEYEKNAPELLP